MSLLLKVIGILLLFLILFFLIIGFSERHGISFETTFYATLPLLVIVAIYVCLLSDKEQRQKALKHIRKNTQSLSPVPKETFDQAFDTDHIDIAYKARNEISSFFEIEAEKISPNCNIWAEFALEYFEPFFTFQLGPIVFPDLHDTLPKGTIIDALEISIDENMDFVEFVKSLKTYKDNFIKRYNEENSQKKNVP